MNNSTMTFDDKLARSVYLRPPEDHLDSDQLTGGQRPPAIDQLINPSWAEVEGALDRYNRDSKRLRHWQWWFVGMFTFYTTLVGILLLELMTGH